MWKFSITNTRLLADRIIYDRNKNVLIAEGNVRIKEPGGAIIKADRIRLTDDFREGFINSIENPHQRRRNHHG